MKIFGHRKREADDVVWSLDERFLFEMLLRVVPDQVYFKDVRSRFLCVSPTATRANVRARRRALHTG